MKMRILVPAIALLSWAAVGVGGAIPAAASCAGYLPGAPTPPPPALIFVGTVTATADQDRTATVHVDEVWTGQRIPAEVILRGSPDVAAAATSVDRHYQKGRQYLFIPASASGPPYEDNSCSATSEFTATMAAKRPSSVIRYPAAPAAPPLLPLAAAAFALLGAALYVVYSVRRHRGGRAGAA